MAREISRPCQVEPVPTPKMGLTVKEAESSYIERRMYTHLLIIVAEFILSVAMVRMHHFTIVRDLRIRRSKDKKMIYMHASRRNKLSTNLLPSFFMHLVNDISSIVLG